MTNILKAAMSSLKDKHLHLLGILHTQEVHGYQLSTLLKAPANPIRIGKANAYQLLDSLKKKGLVRAKEERVGNRPPRQVFSITPAGRIEFDRVLNERLAEHDPAEFPDGVSLNLINNLKPKRALAMLKQRRTLVADRCVMFAEFSDEIRARYPGLDYVIRKTELERKFLSELIKRYKKKT